MPRQRKATMAAEERHVTETPQEEQELSGFEFYFPRRQRAVETERSVVSILATGAIVLSSDLASMLIDEVDNKGYVQLAYSIEKRQILIRRAAPTDRGVLRMSKSNERTTRYRINARSFLEQHSLLKSNKETYDGEWHHEYNGVLVTLS